MQRCSSCASRPSGDRLSGRLSGRVPWAFSCALSCTLALSTAAGGCDGESSELREAPSGTRSTASSSGSTASGGTASGSTASGSTASGSAASERTQAADFSEGGAAGPLRAPFAWTRGARGQVDAERTVTRTGPPGLPMGVPRGGTAEASYRIVVGESGRDTTVRTSDLALRLPREPSAPQEALLGLLVASAYLPSARFSSDMETLSLVDPERSGEVLRDAVNQASSPALRQTPMWRELMPVVSGTPEMLQRQAVSVLSPIALLDDIPLERGQLVAQRDERETSAGEHAQQSTMTTLLGTGPCFVGDSTLSCMTVEVTAHYGADALPGGGPATIHSIDGRLRMLLEVANLLPHRIEATKETRFRAPLGDELVDLTETEVLRWVFAWERASIRE